MKIVLDRARCTGRRAGRPRRAQCGLADTTERYATLPYFWSDWHGSRIQFVGLPGEEHEVVSGDLDGEHFVAVYREGDKLIGALTLSGQRHIMKYRRLIARTRRETPPFRAALAVRCSTPAHHRRRMDQP